jgi:hypothetical protein
MLNGILVAEVCPKTVAIQNEDRHKGTIRLVKWDVLVMNRNDRHLLSHQSADGLLNLRPMSF